MWNSPFLFNYSKSREIQYSYQFHQENLTKIYSRKCIQDKMNERIAPTLKMTNAKQQEINLENNHLLHKVTEIQTSKGKYNQNSIQKVKFSRTSNPKIEIRIRDIKKIMRENELLETRLRTVPATINSQRFKDSYYLSQQYCSNLRKFNEKRSNGLLISTTTIYSKEGSLCSEKKSKNFCIKVKSSKRNGDGFKEIDESKEKTKENIEKNKNNLDKTNANSEKFNENIEKNNNQNHEKFNEDQEKFNEIQKKFNENQEKLNESKEKSSENQEKLNQDKEKINENEKNQADFDKNQIIDLKKKATTE